MADAPTPGRETMNASSGESLPQAGNNAASFDSSGQPPASQPGAASDDILANQARQQKAQGNSTGARESISQIKNPAKQQETDAEVFGGDQNSGSGTAPSALASDGSGSLSDPLALFFMMVFYLKEQTPTFTWGNVLKTASDVSGNQQFQNIAPNDGFLPQRSYQDTGNAKAGTGIRGEAEAKQSAEKERLKKEEAAKRKDLQDRKDAETKAMNAKVGSGSSGRGGNAGPVVVWPIQCMPIISGGMNKTVDWPSNQVATLAEPTISINKGSSAIEIDIEFTYAVGVYGVGDGEVAARTGAINPYTGQPTESSDLPQPPDTGKWWTIEEVMGMMYLATSLVYPFKSSAVVSSPADATTPPSKDDRNSAQFPVIFLRHYSLFPFLTPFVVKAVKIEPDENQPLVITEPVNLNKGFKTHLSYPAVRQVVKITLSLISAHYYLPIFGGKDEGGQIKIQTSGETYLQLSKSLLGKRIP